MAVQLEKIVEKPTWKQVLLELIVSEKLDPWDVDLVKIADGFMKKMKEMKKVDLYIPANMILASAILLRYKSGIIKFEEEAEECVEETPAEDYVPPEIPEIKLSSRLPPKRKVSLQELMNHLDKVLKFEEKKGSIIQKKVEEIINLDVEKINMEQKMEEIYSLIVSSMNGGDVVLFSDIVGEKEKKEKIYALLSVLHLTQNEKINIEQKKFFEDITIKIKSD
ncbi:segregation/condensation protein A [Candidatus Micrarchaeota archaeon]|nr:segregation/condensation protein A [Candidatus Micrarchaeota archaeon]